MWKTLLFFVFSTLLLTRCSSEMTNFIMVNETASYNLNLVTDESVVLQGFNTSSLLTCADSNPMFNLSSNSQLTLQNLTAKACAKSFTISVEANSTLILDGVQVLSQALGNHFIYCKGNAKIVIKNSLINSNAFSTFSFVFAEGRCQIEVDSSTFKSNVGVVFRSENSENVTLSVTRSTIESNTHSLEGSFTFFRNAVVNFYLNECFVLGNRAQSGTFLFSRDTRLFMSVSQCNFTGNSVNSISGTTQNGGLFRVTSVNSVSTVPVQIIIEGTYFQNTTAYGGAIGHFEIHPVQVEIRTSRFIYTGSNFYGGLHFRNTLSVLLFDRSVFFDANARRGPFAYAINSSLNATILDSSFIALYGLQGSDGNVLYYEGASSVKSSVNFTNTEFRNFNCRNGGVLFSRSINLGTVSFVNVTGGPLAGTWGGLVYLQTLSIDRLSITNSVLTKHDPNLYEGGIVYLRTVNVVSSVDIVSNEISNIALSDNAANTEAGGVIISYSSSCVLNIRDNVFNNFQVESGSIAYLFNSSSSLYFSNNSIDNHVTKNGAIQFHQMRAASSIIVDFEGTKSINSSHMKGFINILGCTSIPLFKFQNLNLTGSIDPAALYGLFHVQDSNTTLILENIAVSDNKPFETGAYLASFVNSDSSLILRNSRISNNFGRSFLSGDQKFLGFSVEDSTFRNNEAAFQIDSPYSDSASVSFTNTVFLDYQNSISLFGNLGPDILIDNCEFNFHSYQPGKSIINNQLESSALVIRNTKFQSNKGTLMSLGGSGKTIIDNLTIFNSTTDDTSITSHSLINTYSSSSIQIFNSSIHTGFVTNIIYSGSSGSFYAERMTIDSSIAKYSLIQSVQGDLEIQDLYVSPVTLISGSCLVIKEISHINIENFHFQGCQSDSNLVGVASSSGHSVVMLKNGSILNSIGGIGSVFLARESSTFSIEDLSIINSTSTNSYGVITANGDGVKFEIKKVKIELSKTISGPSILAVQSQASVNASNFTSNYGESLDEGTCILIDTGNLSMDQGELLYCKSPMEGSAIQIRRKSDLEIRNFDISHHTSQEGTISAKSLFQSNIYFENCKFHNNSADEGGVFYFSFKKSENRFEIKNCSLRDNSATSYGGVYVSVNSEVKFENCLFENSQSKIGGVGFQDWESFVELKNCNITNSRAIESGGSFYVDKTSSLTITGSSVTNSSSYESGGFIYAGTNSIIQLLQSKVENCSAGVNGGGIATSTPNECQIKIDQVDAIRNFATNLGGFFYVSQSDPSTYSISNLRCSLNEATYGGCVYITKESTRPSFNKTDFVFENNTAAVFGPNIFIPPSYALSNIRNRITIQSGDPIPSIKYTLYDLFDQKFLTSLNERFTVVIILNGTQGFLQGETQRDIVDGVVTFSGSSSSSDQLRLFSDPGDFTLYVGPQNNDPIYSPSKFGIWLNVTVNPCGETFSVGKDKGCVENTCPGCNIAQGAKCVSPGNCTCPPNLDGLNCNLQKDKQDSILLILPFSSVSTPVKRATQEITVQLRDQLIKETTEKVIKVTGTNSTTIEYRSLTKEGDMLFFKFSVKEGGKYIEGTALVEISSKLPLIAGASSQVAETETTFLNFSDPLVVVVLIISFLFFATTLAVGAAVVKYKEQPIIRASSPLFCLFIIFGLLLSFVNFFPYIGEPTTLKCSVQVIIGPLAFSIVFSNLLVKTFRIYRIFGNKKMRVVAPTNKSLLISSSFFVGLELLIIIIWLAVEAPTPEKYRYGEKLYHTCPTTSVGWIFSGILLAYNAGMIVVGTLLAISTRKVYSAFRESQLIGFTVYSIAIVSIVVLPILYSIEAPLSIQFAIRQFSIIFVSAVALSLLFGTKMFIIFFKPSENTISNNSSERSNISGSVKMNDFYRDLTGKETETIERFKMSVRKVGLLSRWTKVTVFIYGKTFGFFDSRGRGGMRFVDTISAEINPEGISRGFTLYYGDESWEVDSTNVEELQRVFDYLPSSRPRAESENQQKSKLQLKSSSSQLHSNQV